jgi:uncharacterized protein (DUF2267 family)
MRRKCTINEADLLHNQLVAVATAIPLDRTRKGKLSDEMTPKYRDEISNCDDYVREAANAQGTGPQNDPKKAICMIAKAIKSWPPVVFFLVY